ncbi:MAG TPA: tetratricopeptide repeat protein, partial [bacterium]|nr:tetratricopeptide repeat protein [bacterium]
MALFGSKDDKKKELIESAQKLAEQGDSSKALKEIQKALDIDPNYREAYTAMGFIYSDLGQAEDAITAFKKATVIDHSSTEAWNNLGLAYARAERYNDAIK